MDNETIEKLRNAVDKIEAALKMPPAAHSIITGWLRHMRHHLDSLPAPPKAEPARGPYKAQAYDRDQRWRVISDCGGILAPDLREPTARLLAASWAMNELLHNLRYRSMPFCTQHDDYIDDLFREYGL